MKNSLAPTEVFAPLISLWGVQSPPSNLLMFVNPLEYKGNYCATSNNIKLVVWYTKYTGR